jgi:hypothetical protein
LLPRLRWLSPAATSWFHTERTVNNIWHDATGRGDFFAPASGQALTSEVNYRMIGM